MVILIFVLRPCLLSTTALKSAVYIKQCHIGCAFFLISWLKPVLLNMKTLVRIHSPPQLYKLAQCGSGLKPFEHLVKLCRAYFVCNERLISNFISFLLMPLSFLVLLYDTKSCVLAHMAYWVYRYIHCHVSFWKANHYTLSAGNPKPFQDLNKSIIYIRKGSSAFLYTGF